MIDSDYHWFIGGGGDDNDLMGFPGMWEGGGVADQDADADLVDEDMEVGTNLLSGWRLPIDIVVATALLLFGLRRLSQD